MPRASEIGIDFRVLLFTMAITLLCGVLFGMAPALRISRSNLQETLKEGGARSGGSKNRAQSAFVVAEMAMALVLLISAGLMIRSLHALWGVNPGFNPRNVLTFSVSLSPAMKDASADSIRATLREVHRSLASVPGARAVSLSWAAVPLATDDEDLFWIEGQPKPSSANDMNWALSYVVEEDYLEAMGIPLLRGRFFNTQDNEHTAHVVVIDDVFAHQYFPDRDPLGKRINLDSKGGVAEIVGVVGHVKQWGLDSDDKQSLRAQLYIPYMQLPDQAMLLSANGTGALAKFDNLTPDTAANLRTALKRMNGDQVMYGVQSMEEVIADTLQTRRAGMVVLGTFAALALSLASIGIYGVISYLVSQRTREIGIRVALGAKRTDVFGMILGEGLKMTLLGLGIGLVAAIALTRLMASLLFGVSATDPLTFLAVAAILTVVALAACYVPARRATKVDPIVALRYE